MKPKTQNSKLKVNLNNKYQKTSNYNLEERTHKFARECRNFISEIPKTITNIEYCKQLARSSGSVASNWIEANESLSKKDFNHRVKICRKETKESRLWLRLCDIKGNLLLNNIQSELEAEAYELTKIFGSMVYKSN